MEYINRSQNTILSTNFECTCNTLDIESFLDSWLKCPLQTPPPLHPKINFVITPTPPPVSFLSATVEDLQSTHESHTDVI